MRQQLPASDELSELVEAVFVLLRSVAFCTAEQMAVFGWEAKHDAEAELESLKRELKATEDAEAIERLELIVEIFAFATKMFRGEQSLIKAWVVLPAPELEGKTPKELLTSGDQYAIVSVRDYIRFFAGVK